MHIKRWITALILLPILIYVIIRGGDWFAAFVCLVAVLGVWEYYRIVYKTDDGWRFGILPFTGLVMAPTLIWTAHRFTAELLLLALVTDLLLCAAVSLALFGRDATIPEKIARQVQGLVYIPLLLCFAVFIRNGSDGLRWIFFVLAIVFAGDVGAYYGGSYWGKHKLCPSVSPGKTREGAAFGLLSNLVVGAICQVLFFPRLIWTQSFVFFLCIGVAGQVGDLFESEFKRAAGVKDSGGILPGHGGMLDRIDAVLFALPVAYFFKKFILWV